MKDDTISRWAVIRAVDKHTREDGTLDDDISCILEDLPPAQPKSYREGYQAGFKDGQRERKRGRWIEDDDGWDGVIWRCSECDALFTLVDGTPEENEYYFCPHCGADMREVSDERPD